MRSIGFSLSRLIVGCLAAVLMTVFAGGLYLRHAWQQWMEQQALQQVDWHGYRVSLSGVHADGFSLSKGNGAQGFTVRGHGVSLGWNWKAMTLTELQVERLELVIPAWSPPESGSAQSEPMAIPETPPTWLPETIAIQQLSASFPGDIAVQGDLELRLGSDPDQWRAETAATWIKVARPEVAHSGWVFRDVRARVGVTGSANGRAMDVDVLPDSTLRAARARGPGGAMLAQLVANAGGLHLKASYDLAERSVQALAYAGPVKLAVQTLQHPLLITQSWRFGGYVDGNPDQLKLAGPLTSQAGVVADLSLLWPMTGVPQVTVSSQLAGEKASKALSGTLRHWPADLEFSKGQIDLQAQVRLPDSSPVLEATLRARGLAGIFDRTAWNGLNGELRVGFDETLNLSTSALELDQLNPGMAIGPVIVSGRYTAPKTGVLDGVLALTSAQAEVLGGEAQIGPGEWRWADLPARVPVTLTNVQLARLMKAYPAEGLDGTGSLHGTLPLTVGQNGVQIKGGSISAREPGGTLQFPAERLRAVAQSNDTMNLVVQALQDFHYTVLNTTIDYDHKGTLNLGLRLEGNSPDVQDGHPLILNINLEEDIPALLTSLQLSGRVNDAVAEKVRSMLQKREAAKPGQ